MTLYNVYIEYRIPRKNDQNIFRNVKHVDSTDGWLTIHKDNDVHLIPRDLIDKVTIESKDDEL